MYSALKIATSLGYSQNAQPALRELTAINCSETCSRRPVSFPVASAQTAKSHRASDQDLIK